MTDPREWRGAAAPISSIGTVLLNLCRYQQWPALVSGTLHRTPRAIEDGSIRSEIAREDKKVSYLFVKGSSVLLSFTYAA